MMSSRELVGVVQREREQLVERERVACLASCVRVSCSSGMLERVARALRLSSSSC
jgi:predicted DNA-binding ribbon-helix-helix protein